VNEAIEGFVHEFHSTDWSLVFLLLLLIATWAVGMFFLFRFVYRSLRRAPAAAEVTRAPDATIGPPNIPDSDRLEYERPSTAAGRVMQPVTVVILSVVPGLASVLLRGRVALKRSMILIGSLALLPVVVTVVGNFLFPYPHRELRNWSQTIVFWSGVVVILGLSVRRGLEDRLEVIQRGDTPAYRQASSGASPIRVLFSFIALVVMSLLALSIIGLCGGF
jgi:hypothetical protein